MSEVIRSSHALRVALRTRILAAETWRQLSEFKRGQIIHPLSNNDGLTTTGTSQDIRDRMVYQYGRYVELDREGTLTPPWRNFGRHRREEIGIFEGSRSPSSE